MGYTYAEAHLDTHSQTHKTSWTGALSHTDRDASETHRDARRDIQTRTETGHRQRRTTQTHRHGQRTSPGHTQRYADTRRDTLTLT